MDKFIDLLYDEILFEAESDGEIPDKVQQLLSKLVYKEPFVARLFSRSNTDWIADSSIETAGVMPKLGRIKFYYNPGFINGLSMAELNFLLQHEIYHIFRSHSSRGSGIGATSQRLHYLFNISADSYINADCKKDGGFGGQPMSVIKGAWFAKKTTDEYGSVEDAWKKNDKDKYPGGEQSEALYKWMKERDAQQQKKQQPPPSGPPGPPQQQPPWEPSVGDIIYNKKTGKYGKVSDLTGKSVKVTEISEENAETELGKQGFKQVRKQSRKTKYKSLLA